MMQMQVSTLPLEQFFIVMAGGEQHIVQAKTDYQAACRVRLDTGFMAQSEQDVKGPFAEWPVESAAC